MNDRLKQSDLRDLDPAMDGLECEWGTCDNLAAFERYDAYGGFWILVCEDCAVSYKEVREVSIFPTRYAVQCEGCGRVFLTEREFSRQVEHPTLKWECPRCGAVATWDDENYERNAGP